MRNVKSDSCRLSIITINKNNAEGLKKTIESVVNQTYKDFEYIVIDGASTDGSVDIVKEFEAELTYWISEPDQGIYSAMNKGIKQASGEYCLFLNSGDYLYNNNVIKNIFKENLNSEIIACAIKSVNQKRIVYNYPPKEVSLSTFTSGSLLHPSTFIRRDLFKRFGYFDENFKIISDWKFFLEVLIIHNCTYSSKTDIISVFDSGNGISTLQGQSEKLDADKILKAYFPRIFRDYFLEIKVEYEYCQNILNILRKNKFILHLIKPLLRLINRVTGGRINNDCLISVKRIKQT